MNRKKRSQIRAIAFVVAYIFLYYLWIILMNNNTKFIIMIENIFQIAAPIIVGFWIFKQYLIIKTKIRFFWLLSSLASFCFAVGMILFRIGITFEFSNAYTGISNVFWITSLFLYLGALIYANSLNKSSSKTVQYIFDIIIVMVVASSISYHFIIDPIIKSSLEQGLLFTVLYVGYPIGNLAMLFAILSFYYSSTSIFPRKIFIFSLAGFTTLLFVNMMFLYLSINKLYATGSLFDPLWSIAILLAGLGCFYNEEVDEESIGEEENVYQHSRFQDLLSLKLTLPYISVIIIFAFMIFQSELIINSIVIGAILSTLLIIIRQVFTLVQNNELLLKSQGLNKELETKVNQRTKELYCKNQQLEETIKKVEYIAYHDSLTSLTNRRYFEEALQKAIIEAQSKGQDLAILFIDLDRFKFINDTLGHTVGDKLLQAVAEILKENVGEKNIVSRQGGDEFMIMLNNTSRAEATELAQQIITELEKPIHINGNELYITSSIGISMFPANGIEVDELIKRADTSMYVAKDKGKNQYQFFDESMDEHVTTKLNIENGLRRAIDQNELSLAYQPKIDLKTKSVTGVEALLRWRNPQFGYISPATFIPIAEETGLIIKLGEWVLKEACMQLKKWYDLGLSSLTISVNVSGIQFLQKDFVERIEKVLEETLVDASHLELEITESTMMDTQQVLPILKRLKQLGIKISVDDFGSGYSSLSHIKKLPIDILKIDQMFIQEIDNEISDVAIVSTIITLAKNLSLTVIAEGVENEKQLNILIDKGCDQIQGYYFSKPLTPDEFLLRFGQELKKGNNVAPSI